jgi:hypothetical protein
MLSVFSQEFMCAQKGIVMSIHDCTFFWRYLFSSFHFQVLGVLANIILSLVKLCRPQDQKRQKLHLQLPHLKWMASSHVQFYSRIKTLELNSLERGLQVCLALKRSGFTLTDRKALDMEMGITHAHCM